MQDVKIVRIFRSAYDELSVPEPVVFRFTSFCLYLERNLKIVLKEGTIIPVEASLNDVLVRKTPGAAVSIAREKNLHFFAFQIWLYQPYFAKQIITELDSYPELFSLSELLNGKFISHDDPQSFYNLLSYGARYITEMDVRVVELFREGFYSGSASVRREMPWIVTLCPAYQAAFLPLMKKRMEEDPDEDVRDQMRYAVGVIETELDTE